MTRPDEWIVETIQRVGERLESWGVPVVWIDGWQDRGRPWAFNPQGLVIHHTATHGYEWDYPSLGIVRDGRSDLPGPLAQFGLARHTGSVIVIAAGFSNHAGEGGWQGLSGNGSVWGVEAENDGIGEEWSEVVRRNYVLLALALTIEGGFGPDYIACHREWSQWKIDPTGIDGDEFRAQVANGGPNEEDEMTQDERNTLAYAKSIAEEWKAFAGRFDPQGEGDYWRGQNELERLAKDRDGGGTVTIGGTYTITGTVDLKK